MSSAAILQAFSQLQPSQQIQLVEDLWDQIAQAPTAPPLSQAQKNELRLRKQASGESPKGRPWSEVMRSLNDTDGQ